MGEAADASDSLGQVFQELGSSHKPLLPRSSCCLLDGTSFPISGGDNLFNSFMHWQTPSQSIGYCTTLSNIVKNRLHVLYLSQRGYHDYITITQPRMNVKFIYCAKCGMNELRTEVQRLYQHPNHFVCSRLLRALHTQVYRSKLSKVSTK